jgi:hypothetical protein
LGTQAPVKIAYCTGDQQVNYLNGVRADSAWNANGSPDVTSQNFGNLDHGPCVEPALTSTALYLLGKIAGCTGINESSAVAFRVYPNPANSLLNIVKEEGVFAMNITDINGRLVYSKNLLLEKETVDLTNYTPGVYTIQLRNNDGRTAHRKLIVQ